MKTYEYTDDQRKYLDMMLSLHTDGKLHLSTYQIAAIKTIKTHQYYGPFEKGVLNSIKYTYEKYLRKQNEGTKI